MKRRVLIVIPNLGKGGAERVASYILRDLPREEFELGVVFFDNRHVHAIPSDVRVHCLDIPGASGIAGKVSRTIRRIFRMRAIVAAEKPDVVFSFMNTVNLAVILATRLLRHRPRVIVSERNTPSLQLRGRFASITRLLIGILYRHADTVVAVSNGVADDLASSLRVPREKITTIYNPVDVDGIRKAAREEVTEHPWFQGEVPIVINVASLTEQKGQDDLIRAFAMVRKERDCRLAILGEGPREAMLKALAAELGVGNDVAFLGFQRNPYKFMARAKVFVLSSHWEGFPNVLLEALSCGLYVVSTDCLSGPSEIIMGNNGDLVEPGNIKNLKLVIDKVLEKNIGNSIFINTEENVKKWDKQEILNIYKREFLK